MNADQIVSSGVISKKEICHLLGLVFPDGRCDHASLGKHYFKDTVLLDLGISRDEYKSTRIFDKIKTKMIIGRLELHLISPKLRLLLG